MSALFDLAADYGSEEEEECVDQPITIEPSTFSEIQPTKFDIQASKIESDKSTSSHNDDATASPQKPQPSEEYISSNQLQITNESAGITASFQEDSSSLDAYKHLNKLPPPSTEPPSLHLQQLLDRYKSGQADLSNMVDNIINDKSFGNPSFLSQVVDYFHIDECGTNYSPEVFNPKAIDQSAFQKLILDRLEGAQPQPAILPAAAKPQPTNPISAATTTLGTDQQPKKRSKWDLH